MRRLRNSVSHLARRTVLDQLPHFAAVRRAKAAGAGSPEERRLGWDIDQVEDHRFRDNASIGTAISSVSMPTVVALTNASARPSSSIMPGSSRAIGTT
jgi:hypothetical protein